MIRNWCVGHKASSALQISVRNWIVYWNVAFIKDNIVYFLIIISNKHTLVNLSSFHPTCVNSFYHMPEFLKDLHLDRGSFVVMYSFVTCVVSQNVVVCSHDFSKLVCVTGKTVCEKLLQNAQSLIVSVFMEILNPHQIKTQIFYSLLFWRCVILWVVTDDLEEHTVFRLRVWHLRNTRKTLHFEDSCVSDLRKNMEKPLVDVTFSPVPIRLALKANAGRRRKAPPTEHSRNRSMRVVWST